MKKKFILFLAAAFLFTCLSFIPASASEPSGISLTLQGEAMELDAPVLMSPDADRVLIPVRPFCEAIGAEVTWNEDQQEIIVIYDTLYLTFSIGQPVLYKSLIYQSSLGTPISLDTPPALLHDRAYLAVRPLMEALGYAVDWDEANSAVHLEKMKNTYPMPTQAPPKSPADTFTSDFYQQIAAMEEQNFMVSPMSLRIALAMLANGTQNETQAQIQKITGISELADYNQTIRDLIAAYAADEKTTLSIANSIWMNEDYLKNHFNIKEPADFSDTYKETIKEFYGGASSVVNDKNAVKTINSWIEDHTNGKIKDMLTDSGFLYALVNALYMNADWQRPFAKEATQNDTFHQADGTQAQIPFMWQTDYFEYLKTEQYQAVRLPYQSDRGLSMYVVLPERGADPTAFLGRQKEMQMKKVALSLPKFKIESFYTLNDILKSMGMSKAFSPSGVFAPMTENSPLPLFVSQVLQKTYIAVDEKGTEAAAATVISVDAGSPGPQPEEIVEFKADRPFSYFICDDLTGETLFMGRYACADAE